MLIEPNILSVFWYIHYLYVTNLTNILRRVQIDYFATATTAADDGFWLSVIFMTHDLMVTEYK